MTRRLAPCLLGFVLIGGLALGACSDPGHSGDSVDDAAAFCAQLVSAADPFTADEDSLDSVAEDLRQLRDLAPEEIKDAVGVLVVAFERVAAEPDPGTDVDLVTEQQAELVAATEELAAYSLATCAIDLNR